MVSVSSFTCRHCLGQMAHDPALAGQQVRCPHCSQEITMPASRSRQKSHEWFYVVDGKRIGPVSTARLKQLAASSDIRPDDLIWREGMEDWQPARSIDGLCAMPSPPVPSQTGPPPHNESSNPFDFIESSSVTSSMPGTSVSMPQRKKEINNTLVWIVAFVPIIGAFIELIMGMQMYGAYYIPNSLLSVTDIYLIKKSGQLSKKEDRSFPYFFSILIPLYMWKRAELLKQDKHYLWVWIVTFVISIPMFLQTEVLYIERSAEPIVTQILRENGSSRKCVSVDIYEEVTSTYYLALATLDNGKVIKITITALKNDRFYVEIPLNQAFW